MPRPTGASRAPTLHQSAAADSVADRLHSIAIHLLRRVRTEDVETGLTGPRASALSVLVFRGPLSLGALAALEQVRAPTMSRVVAALVQAGLARRTSDPADARVTLLDATPEGKRLLEAGRRRRVRAITTMLTGLPARDLAMVRRAVQLLEAMVQVPAATAPRVR